MPIIEQSSYRAPFYFNNGHVATIFPSIFRKVNGVAYCRERFNTLDGDFLDLDWLKQSSDRLVIISHGLEGNSERHYTKGMAKYFYEMGWDALAWNCRSCSGEINRKPRFYHHGATSDLKEVIDHALSLGKYNYIGLVGFSMGGSLTLKYLGEEGVSLPDEVGRAAVFSVPCHLKSSVKELNRRKNSFYRKRFLKKLINKIKAKSAMFPAILSIKDIDRIKYFEDFDNRYTAPLHGFKDADDFYNQASANLYIPFIARPTLLVNAANDPFLPDACYPFDLAKENHCFHLEVPEKGGHVGFLSNGALDSWMEKRAYDFVQPA